MQPQQRPLARLANIVCVVLAVLVIAANGHAQPSADTSVDLNPLPPTTEVKSAGQTEQYLVQALSWDQQSSQGTNGSGASSMQAFMVPAFDQPEVRRLNNNFTAAPIFDSGMVIHGDDVAMKIGGYVKADLIHDFDAINSPDTFDTTDIPVGGPQFENTRFHARQSRMSFDTRWRIDGEVARTFVEGDFFGGDPNSNDNDFRLRHAYGRIGRFTAGQTWTTFTDPSAVPQTIDFEGAVSNVNRRQGLVRWDQPLWDESWRLAVAIENPEIQIEVPTAVVGEARTESPDFITRLRYEQDWGEFQSALVVRELGFQPANQAVITENAWGFNFTGSFFLLADTKAYYQITFGEGIGSYRGSPDVVATGPNTASILPMFGWMVGAHHQWNDRWTSNLTFSELSLEGSPGQDPDNLRNTTYLAINLIANPYERVFCGIEYLYGIREDVDGDSGDANRLQIACGFFLP